MCCTEGGSSAPYDGRGKDHYRLWRGTCALPVLHSNCACARFRKMVCRMSLFNLTTMMNYVWRYAYSCCFSLPHSEPFFLAASSILAGNTNSSLLKYAENAYDHPFLNGTDWTHSSLGSLGVQPETMCYGMLPSFRQMKADLTYYPFPLSTRTVKRASSIEKIPLNAALLFCFLCGIGMVEPSTAASFFSEFAKFLIILLQ